MDLYSVRQQLNIGIPLTNIKLRVTDYSRVSTFNVRQQNSLKNQIEHFDEMIKQNPNWTYINGYVDEGITGTSDIKRDNFMRMIEDAKSGKFDLIVTKEISRFSRNTLDSIKYTRELLQNGVAVLFVNDNINTALPDSELRLTIMASMAQDEIRRLSERVKFGMNRAIKNGNILGNDRLFGYNKNKITGNLEIDEKQAEVLKEIYDMYIIEDLSLNKIVKILKERNIKTGANKTFCVSTLSRMLRNPKYKGYYCGKKSEIVDYMTKKVKYFEMDDWVMYEDHERIPPIISDEMWDKGFDKIISRSKSFKQNAETTDNEEKVLYQVRYPLSAKIICSTHNTPFYRRKLSRNSDDIVWCCAEYLTNGKDKCEMPLIRQSEIYSIFDDIFKKLSINLNEVSNMLISLYESNENNVNIDASVSKYNNDIEKIEQKKDKLLELNMSGVLSNNEFKERNDKYNLELLELEEKIQNLKNSKKNFENIDKKNKQLKNLLKQKVVTTASKDRLIELLLNKIIVSRINDNRNDTELKIFFNFSEKFVKTTNNNLIPETDGFKSFLRKNYEFKRGYNKTGTKRYTVRYRINCYICL